MTAPPRLALHPTARAFLDRASPWLMRSEAEHALLLAIAGRLPAGPTSALLTTVEGEGGVVGVAMRTPPHKLLLTRMPLDVLPLVADAAEAFGPIPAVLGPPAVAKTFGTVWAGRHGVQARPGMRQRVFSLTRLVPPPRPAPGHARPATVGDLDTVVEWLAAFHDETGVAGSEARPYAERLVAAGDLWLWVDGGPVAMAAVVGHSPHGVRVGAVYTPASRRGRGYASAVVAAVSQQALDEDRRFCSLYTDLSNPTSNAIYQRLGYEPVADVMDVDFKR